jgi:hypothetical protein
MADKWTQPASPPPPLFVGKKERDFVKQVNDEVIERVIGQQVLYFPIDVTRTDYHPVYGEAMKKTFLPPVRVYSLVEYNGSNRVQERFGFDAVKNITVHFHKKRLTEDQDLVVRLGDFVQYDEYYFEIVDVSNPKYLFGQDKSFTNNNSFEVVATCRQARRGLFDAV